MGRGASAGRTPDDSAWCVPAHEYKSRSAAFCREGIPTSPTEMGDEVRVVARILRVSSSGGDGERSCSIGGTYGTSGSVAMAVGEDVSATSSPSSPIAAATVASAFCLSAAAAASACVSTNESVSRCRAQVCSRQSFARAGGVQVFCLAIDAENVDATDGVSGTDTRESEKIGLSIRMCGSITASRVAARCGTGIFGRIPGGSDQIMGSTLPMSRLSVIVRLGRGGRGRAEATVPPGLARDMPGPSDMCRCG